MVDFKVCVVIPAGGSGERMSLKEPKQYVTVLNRPLLSYTIESFERTPWIEHIIVPVNDCYREKAQQIIDDYNHKKVTLVTGGATRHRSIFEGLKGVSRVCPSPEIVIIHDAVRPFVDDDVIMEVVEAAREHGAAGLIRPLVSTVIATNGDNFLDHALDRSKYMASEMPQAFQFDIIKSAYEKCTDYDFDYGTECLHLAQRYGGCKVKLIQGPSNLWKVTHRKDLFMAEGAVKEKYNQVGLIQCHDPMFYAAIELAFKKKKIEICQCDDIHNLPSGTNNPIFLYNVLDQDEMTLNTLNCAPHIVRHFGGTIIHFIFMDAASDQVSEAHKSGLMLRDLVETYSKYDVCVNIILVQGSGSLVDASAIVATLISDRNKSLSGQVFVVRERKQKEEKKDIKPVEKEQKKADDKAA